VAEVWRLWPGIHKELSANAHHDFHKHNLIDLWLVCRKCDCLTFPLDIEMPFQDSNMLLLVISISVGGEGQGAATPQFGQKSVSLGQIF